MIALAVALSVLVGISLGLLGGGGSILMVPLLVYVAGIEPKHAIATSLLVVGVTGLFAAITHARAGRVRWGVAGLFGAAAMAGAYVGGLLAGFVPGDILLVSFAVIMVLAGAAMLRGRRGGARAGTDIGDDASRLPIGKVLALGAAVGVISGLVGAGGGFLLVPALTLLADLPMPAAVGTSLIVIAAQSFAGLAGHLATEPIDWRLAGMVTAAAVAGSFLGGRLVSKVDASALRTGFGWFVLAMAALVLGLQTTPVVGLAVGATVALAAMVVVVCPRIARCPLRRTKSAHASPANRG